MIGCGLGPLLTAYLFALFVGRLGVHYGFMADDLVQSSYVLIKLSLLPKELFDQL